MSEAPDLVLIGFGMNDHNREGFGLPLEAFARNLRTMIDRIRADTDAEIITPMIMITGTGFIFRRWQRSGCNQRRSLKNEH
ncbi:MAG: SGNH/GDSL hydrolase family protein [Verrucomicrobiota bacterium]